jgi:hypothetical protein
VDAFLHRQQQVGIGGFGPEVLHDGHGVEEGLRIGLAGGETGIFDHGPQGGIATQLPPARLDFGLGEPLDVFKRGILLSE